MPLDYCPRCEQFARVVGVLVDDPFGDFLVAALEVSAWIKIGALTTAVKFCFAL